MQPLLLDDAAILVMTEREAISRSKTYVRKMYTIESKTVNAHSISHLICIIMKCCLPFELRSSIQRFAMF